MVNSLCEPWNAEDISAGSYYFTNGGGDPDADAPRPAAQETTEDTVRIRHYTNRSGINGIEDSGVIRASDQNRVFGEPARGKPLSPAEAKDKYGLAPGHGRDYVETDVLASRVQRVWNAKTRAFELVIKGDVQLLNAVFIRRS
jgi:hypothetical protein